VGLYMDSYIVRIYRRTENEKGEEVAGLVEEIGSDQRRSFQSYSGLHTTIKQIIGKGKEETPRVYDLHADKEIVSK